MPIYIPDKVKMFSRTFTVNWMKDLKIKNDCCGEIRYRTQNINMQQHCENDPRHHEVIEQAFFHELVHGWFNELCECALRDNEPFVDRLGSIVYQSLRDSGMLTDANYANIIAKYNKAMAILERLTGTKFDKEKDIDNLINEANQLLGKKNELSKHQMD